MSGISSGVEVPAWGAWTNVDGGVGFANSWVDFGIGWALSSYRQHTDGMVQIRGMIKSGTVDQIAFTLPSGLRPPLHLTYAVDSNGVYGRVDIQTTGAVKPKAGSNVWFALNFLFDSTGGS